MRLGGFSGEGLARTSRRLLLLIGREWPRRTRLLQNETRRADQQRGGLCVGGNASCSPEAWVSMRWRIVVAADWSTSGVASEERMYCQSDGTK